MLVMTSSRGELEGFFPKPRESLPPPLRLSSFEPLLEPFEPPISRVGGVLLLVDDQRICWSLVIVIK